MKDASPETQIPPLMKGTSSETQITSLIKDASSEPHVTPLTKDTSLETQIPPLIKKYINDQCAKIIRERVDSNRALRENSQLVGGLWTFVFFGMMGFVAVLIIYMNELKTIGHVYNFFENLQSLRKGDVFDANGDTQRLHHFVRALATANPQSQRSIDEMFRDLEAIGEEHRVEYDAIIKRFSADLVAAEEPKFSNHGARHQVALERAYEDFILLTDTVVFEIRKRHPELQSHVDTFRDDLRLMGLGTWSSFASIIQEGHEAILTRCEREGI